MTKNLRVNSDRMLESFNQLALIGATADGGVDRSTFSEAHLAARKWFHEEVERSGLEFRVDGAGNHSAFLALPKEHRDDVSGGGAEVEAKWTPSTLKPGQKLNQPAPLFKKLEERVIEEERSRLGK